MRVKKLPMILALHLKRFKYMEQLHRYTKLSYRVVFPLELRLFNTSGDAVNLDRMYDLVAVVVHCGRYSILIIIHIAKVRVMDLVTPGKSRYVRLLLCHVLEFKKITQFIFFKPLPTHWSDFTFFQLTHKGSGTRTPHYETNSTLPGYFSLSGFTCPNVSNQAKQLLKELRKST